MDPIHVGLKGMYISAISLASVAMRGAHVAHLGQAIPTSDLSFVLYEPKVIGATEAH